MPSRDVVSELFDDPEKGARREQLEAEIERLESIRRADYRRLWTTDEESGKPRMLAPSEWGDDEAAAILDVTPIGDGSTARVRMVDPLRASETLTALKGLRGNDDENENPLAQAFARIPRSQLLELAKALKRMAELDDDPDDENALA